MTSLPYGVSREFYDSMTQQGFVYSDSISWRLGQNGKRAISKANFHWNLWPEADVAETTVQLAIIIVNACPGLQLWFRSSSLCEDQSSGHYSIEPLLDVTSEIGFGRVVPVAYVRSKGDPIADKRDQQMGENDMETIKLKNKIENEFPRGQRDLTASVSFDTLFDGMSCTVPLVASLGCCPGKSVEIRSKGNPDSHPDDMTESYTEWRKDEKHKKNARSRAGGEIRKAIDGVSPCCHFTNMRSALHHVHNLGDPEDVFEVVVNNTTEPGFNIIASFDDKDRVQEWNERQARDWFQNTPWGLNHKIFNLRALKQDGIIVFRFEPKNPIFKTFLDSSYNRVEFHCFNRTRNGPVFLRYYIACLGGDYSIPQDDDLEKELDKILRQNPGGKTFTQWADKGDRWQHFQMGADIPTNIRNYVNPSALPSHPLKRKATSLSSVS